MTLQDRRFTDVETGMRATVSETNAGQADQSGISPQQLVVDTDKPTIKSDIVERQAVEVRPMRYVLGIGLALAIVAMLGAWLLFR